MNNLTKAYQENTGFRSIVSTVAVWLDVVPDGNHTSEWLLDGDEPCDSCRTRQHEEVDAIAAELHRVQAENYELKQKLSKLKEVLR